MDHLRPSRPIRARSWIVATCAASLAACSVQSPPTIRTSVGTAPTAISTIHLVQPESDRTQRAAFHSSVVQALSDRGISISDSAPYVGDLAMSVSPSPVGLYVSEAGKTDAEPSPMATTRETRWYDACEAVRIQASLVLFDRSNGTQLKSSEAESIACADADPPMEEIAALLVEDLLSN